MDLSLHLTESLDQEARFEGEALMLSGDTGQHPPGPPTSSAVSSQQSTGIPATNITAAGSDASREVTTISPDDFINKPPKPAAPISSTGSSTRQSANLETPAPDPPSQITPTSCHQSIQPTSANVDNEASSSSRPFQPLPPLAKMPQVITVPPPPKPTSQSQTNNPAVSVHKPTAAVSMPDVSTKELTMIVKGGMDSVSPDMKISMHGTPILVNGEPATVILNKSLNSGIVRFESAEPVCTPDGPSTTDSDVPTAKTSNKNRRTIGISTNDNVPVEISYTTVVETPRPPIQPKPKPAVQEVTMQRLGDNRVTFLVTDKSRTIFDKDMSSIYHTGDPTLNVFHVGNVSKVTQTNEADIYDFDSFKKQYLPISPQYSYSFVSHCAENETIEFRAAGIETKTQVKEWIDMLGDLSNTEYKVWKTYRPQKDSTYRYLYRCHMNQGGKTLTMKGKNMGCASRVVINVGPEYVSTGVLWQETRQTYRTRIRYRITHNHTEEDSAKHFSVKKEVKDKIMQMYTEGKGVSDAFNEHEEALKQQYGSRYEQVKENRSIAPNRGFFYSVWREYSKKTYGKLIRPPKSSAPKVPWNKGLRGVTSLKEFLPPEEQEEDGKPAKCTKGKKERIREAAVEGLESTLMLSVKQNPETYSKAVSTFVDTWKSMDDRERIVWLQTRIEKDAPQQPPATTMYHTPNNAPQARPEPQLDETQAAADKLFMDDMGDNPSYSDIVVAQHHHQQRLHHQHHQHHNEAAHSSSQQHLATSQAAAAHAAAKRRKVSNHKLDTAAALNFAVGADSGLSYYLHLNHQNGGQL